jgi:hypothetical protein
MPFVSCGFENCLSQSEKVRISFKGLFVEVLGNLEQVSRLVISRLTKGSKKQTGG